MRNPPQNGAALSEAYGIDATPAGTLWEMLSAAADGNPRGTAIVCAQQQAIHLASLLNTDPASPAQWLSWSYGQLRNATETYADALVHAGVRAKPVVLVLLPNSVEFVLTLWAFAKLGGVFCPVNEALLRNPQDLEHIFRLVRPDVVVANYMEAAAKLDSIISSTGHTVPIRIACEFDLNNIKSCPAGWSTMSTVLQKATSRHHEENVELDASRSGEEVAIILLTSGTTGLPKACPHTHTNLLSETKLFGEVRLLKPSDKVMVQSPCFHIQALWTALGAWRAGATVIFPSDSFEAGTSLDVLHKESCTHMSVTPSMIYAMVHHPAFDKERLHNLQQITLGAEMIGEELLETCKTRFGAKAVFPGWGMSEGIGILSWSPDDPVTMKDGILGVGKVLAGAMVRICKPDSQEPLPHGERGELHCGGTSVISGYLSTDGLDRSSDFYDDDVGSWIRTGDEAVMDANDVVYITGRYKDLIIRGGENISAVKLEACLDQIDGIKVQVVGLDDEIAGQVPVAIVQRTSIAHKDDTSNLKQLLRRRVISELGPTFSLAEVFMLEELGLEDYPRTPLGKIRKAELRSAVMQRTHKLIEQDTIISESSGSIFDELARIWGSLTGFSNEHFSASTVVTDLADSLTMMRFCQMVEKSLHKKITLAEIMENTTIEQQASLLQARSEGGQSKSLTNAYHSRAGPPTLQEVVVARGDASKVSDIEDIANSALKPYDLTWESNVDQVCSHTDAIPMFWSRRHRPASFNIRWAFEIPGPIHDTSTVREALERVLTRHALLRSFVVDWTGMPLHIVLRPSRCFFDNCIKIDMCVRTGADVVALLKNMNIPFGGPPDFLYKAHIIYVKETDSVVLFQSVHHYAYDAISMAGFLEDVDTALRGTGNKLTDRIPYKQFADMYYLHRTSHIAQADVFFQLGLLRGLHTLQDALWPKSQGPLWLIGSDVGWHDDSGRLGSLVARQSFDRQESRIEGAPIIHKHTIPALGSIKALHSIEIPTLVKAAIALFNCEQTGHTHAIFSNIEAGRKWPFMEDWTSEWLPNPMDIAGPTLGISLNVISVDPHQTVLGMLHDLQQKQQRQTAHAHAPYFEVEKQLDPKDAELLVDVAYRQLLNWDPSVRARNSDSYKNMRLLGRSGWPEYGVMWNFGQYDSETLVGFIMYDDCHLRNAEADSALGRVFDIVKWIAKAEHWDQQVGDVKSAGIRNL